MLQGYLPIPASRKSPPTRVPVPALGIVMINLNTQQPLRCYPPGPYRELLILQDPLRRHCRRTHIMESFAWLIHQQQKS